MAAPIRWGILATGGIAATFTADLARLPDAVVAAVGSRSAGSAQAFARRHGIARAYGSWQELADDPEVDVVYVATPHPAHFDAAAMCLRAGKAVLCEKPLTMDLTSATELIGMARRAGVFLMEAMWTRTIPAIREVTALVARGDIGEPTHLAADFGVAGPFPPGHRMRDPELGAGAILDLGVYPVTLAHLILGPPVSVSAWASRSAEGVDDNTGLVLGHSRGAVATLHCGLRGATAMRATITGTAGRVELPSPFFAPNGYTLVRSHASSSMESSVDLPLQGNGMVYEAREVMACLREGRTESELVPHEATLAVMATLDQALARIGVTYPAYPGPAGAPVPAPRAASEPTARDSAVTDRRE